MAKIYYGECCSLSNVGPVSVSFEDFLRLVGNERKGNTIVWYDGEKVDVRHPVHNYKVYEVITPAKGSLLGNFNEQGFVPCTAVEKKWQQKIPEEKLAQAIAELSEKIAEYKRHSTWGGFYYLANMLPYTEIERTSVLLNPMVEKMRAVFKHLRRLESLVQDAEFDFSDWYWHQFKTLMPNDYAKVAPIKRKAVAYASLKVLAEELLSILEALKNA